MSYFPLVGLLIGLLIALSYYLLSLIFQKTLSLWLTIGLLAFITRGFHLDGFADTIDGLFSFGSKKKILEVMKDSRIGAFGVLGLIFLIVAKYLALEQLTNKSLYNSLILMPVLGRNAMVLVCYRSPYARSEGGLAKPFTKNLRIKEVIISSSLTFCISLFLMGLKGMVVFLAIALFAFLYRLFFIKRLGGITGDILGAANESSELLCLLILVILINFENL